MPGRPASETGSLMTATRRQTPYRDFSIKARLASAIPATEKMLKVSASRFALLPVNLSILGNQGVASGLSSEACERSMIVAPDSLAGRRHAFPREGEPARKANRA